MFYLKMIILYGRKKYLMEKSWYLLIWYLIFCEMFVVYFGGVRYFFGMYVRYFIYFIKFVFESLLLLDCFEFII